MSAKKPVLTASRLCTKTRGNLGTGADNEDITNYAQATSLIVVAQIDEETGPWTATYSLRWRNETDNPGGSFTLLASTGEVKWASDTDLVNGTNLETGTKYPTGDRLCNTTGGSGSTWFSGEEVEGAATSQSIALPDENYTEVHFAISLADAHEGDQYTFELYENTGPSSVGALGAQITTAVPPSRSVQENLAFAEAVPTVRIGDVQPATIQDTLALAESFPTPSAEIERVGDVQLVTSSTDPSSSSVTVPDGADTCIVGLCGYSSAFANMFGAGSTLTLGGNSFTLIRSDGAEGGTMQTALYKLTSLPSPGSQTLSWNWACTTITYGVHIWVAFYKNVNSIGADGGDQSGTGSGTATTGSLVATSNDLFFGVACHWQPSDGQLAWTNATELNETEYNSEDGACAEAEPSGNITVSVTEGTQHTTISGVILQGSEAAAGGNPQVGDVLASTFDTITFEEALTPEIPGYGPTPDDFDIDEPLAFTEAITIQLVGDLSKSVSEALALTESTPTPEVGTVIVPSLSDALAFQEPADTPAGQIGGVQVPTLSDDLGLAEQITDIAVVGALGPSVSDDLNFSEATPTRQVGDLIVPTLSDALSLVEGLTPELVGDLLTSVFDQLAFTEGVEREIITTGGNEFSAADNLNFSEQVTPEIVGDLLPSVSDTITFQEADLHPQVGDLSVSAGDELTFQEFLEVTLPLIVSVADALSFAESVTDIRVGDLTTSVAETLGLSEGALSPTVGDLFQSLISDALTFTEFAEGVLGAMGDIDRWVSDALAFVENVERQIGTVIATPQADTLTLSENTTQQVVGDLSQTVSDTLAIVENITRAVGDLTRILTPEGLSFTEALTVQVGALLRSISDNLSLSESYVVQVGDLAKTLSETLHFEESANAIIAEPPSPAPSIFDTLTFLEAITATVLGALALSLSDNLHFAEVISSRVVTPGKEPAGFGYEWQSKKTMPHSTSKNFKYEHLN